ncbi:hypothetical protein [Gordonia sp. AC31]|uniref:hypothetical protein n=1 Tax=Gordonia sp. AC31 TaxID=2962571 RepID=UPI00288271F2|nr:hypothetical protein [Gordonia sp. AC31]MDT0223353.1 hypothetical protein [Gordonia sp. AC31]
MNEIVNFAESYWWLIFPVGAVVGGWAGSIGKYNEKRRKDKIELARIKANAQTEQLKLTTTSADQLRRVRKQHDALNEKWFAYELDLATLIEFPLMTDMREPLTLAFHRARVRADDLRPESDSAAVGTAETSMSPADFAEYRDAVGDYAAAFDAAEREARRRKQTGFSPIEREALDRARKLINVAADTGATPAERQAAFKKVRAELDGIIDVPRVAAAHLEQQIAGALERGSD